MKKPPKNFSMPKRDDPDPNDPKKELKDLVWYDALIDSKNRIEMPVPKRNLGMRKTTVDPNRGFADLEELQSPQFQVDEESEEEDYRPSNNSVLN